MSYLGQDRRFTITEAMAWYMIVGGCLLWQRLAASTGG
jgi:hypothetical protein